LVWIATHFEKREDCSPPNASTLQSDDITSEAHWRCVSVPDDSA
jgi:hypothetical protein